MTAYLRSHKPARSQYRSPRRATVSGVIAVHTAENTPDFVAFDGGAEAVARWIVTRTTPGSYHDLVDSDSAIHLVDWPDEAFHDGTGTNPHSLSLSVATRADVWPLAPADWRAGAIEQLAQAAARQARWVKATTGIVVPAKRITAAQARARIPGFVTHAELDPGRRSDPGAGFPWPEFLARFAQLTQTPQEDEDMTVLAWFQDPDKPAERHCYAITGRTAAWCPTTKAIDTQVFFGATWWGGDQTVLDPIEWNDLSLAILTGPLANLRASPTS